MNISQHWSGIAAMCTVLGAELGALKSETSAELAAHTWLFWVLMISAIVGGFAINRMTHGSATNAAQLQQMSAPDPEKPLSTANPPAMPPNPPAPAPAPSALPSV